MEIVSTEPMIAIARGQEEDGRWRAEIESMSGGMAEGVTGAAAISAAGVVALPVAANGIAHGEESGDLSLAFAPTW